MVQKVSALVEGGTVAGVYSSAFSNVPISGITQSAKASQLLPPSEPSQRRSPWGCGSRLGIGLLYLSGIFFLIIGFIGLFDVSVGLGKFSDAWGAIFCFPLGVVFVPTAIAVTRRKNKVAARLKAQNQIERSRWKNAMDNWNELYYCARNDVVFLPNQAGKCVPASQMSLILY